MRIVEVRIQDIRGIRAIPDSEDDQSPLYPDGKNLVIMGKNGTGKSAIIDAIDFLLTGNMQRLEGEGTGGVTVASHGPHTDADNDSGRVEATVRIPSSEEEFTIARSMSDRGTLQYPEEREDEVQSLTRYAEVGQHVLTRSEILHYITRSAGKRAEQIDSLLKVLTVLFQSILTPRVGSVESPIRRNHGGRAPMRDT